MNLFIVLLFMSGAWVFFSKREHLLSILLRLEFLALRVYLTFLVVVASMDLYYGLIYITFAACEGALGLSILVIIRRTHGGDYFFNINLFT